MELGGAGRSYLQICRLWRVYLPSRELSPSCTQSPSSLHQHHKTGPPIDGHNFYYIPFSPTFNVGSLSVVKLMRWSFKIRNPQEPSSQRLDTNIPILGRSIIMQSEVLQQRQFEQEIANTSTFWIFRGQVLSTLTIRLAASS